VADASSLWSRAHSVRGVRGVRGAGSLISVPRGDGIRFEDTLFDIRNEVLWLYVNGTSSTIYN
jgi:hypothetical protein